MKNQNTIFTTILLGLACFGLSSTARAVVPAPDGGYPGLNTAEGQNALLSLTTGSANTAVGWFSLKSNTAGSFNTALGAGTLAANTGDQNTATGAGALLNNTSGGFNSANGAFALFSNTTGAGNTAQGYRALFSNETGGLNTATGWSALFSNTTGGGNTAVGTVALSNNTSASDNTAVGDEALFNNTTGNTNTATGAFALYSNMTGNENTANGFNALYSNTGDDNTAIGAAALQANTTGDGNTAVGSALQQNTTGNGNTAVGHVALFSNNGGGNTALGDGVLLSNTTGNYNTAIGAGALPNNTSGSYNIVLYGGYNLTTGDFNIDIGNNGVAGEGNTIRIGNPIHSRAFIAGTYGVTASGGTAVYISSDGQLGTATSSARFKQNIQGMDHASDVLLELRPVTFRYKPELDPKGTPQFGLVAEEVEKLNPDLVTRDAKGEVYTVRYEAINAMLLNEFLKEHRKVERQQLRITELNSRATKQDAIITRQQTSFQSKLEEQEKQIQILASDLQKVSIQIGRDTSALQKVALRMP